MLSTSRRNEAMEKHTYGALTRKDEKERKTQLNKAIRANERFLESCFKQVALPKHAELEEVRENLHELVCKRGRLGVHVCEFFYKPGRAEAATDISSAFAYSWLNLHLAMQMYANIVSEHFKNRNQHSKRRCAS